MVDTDMLKAKLKAKRMTQEQAARKLRMDPATFNRKINNEDGKVITVKEAKEIGELLSLNNEELVDIFFDEKLANTQG
ncbi:MAG: helix-turn-helix transcriptional regulator [bacterium]|nr:helix-turn-helix transcriptional regulator [bacterium]